MKVSKKWFFILMFLLGIGGGFAPVVGFVLFGTLMLFFISAVFYFSSVNDFEKCSKEKNINLVISLNCLAAAAAVLGVNIFLFSVFFSFLAGLLFSLGLLFLGKSSMTTKEIPVLMHGFSNQCIRGSKAEELGQISGGIGVLFLTMIIIWFLDYILY